MNSNQLPNLILLIALLSNPSNGDESFDVWSFFNERILQTFDEMIGQFVVLVDSMDKYINLSWDKVMIAMDRMVDHAREEDCYFACPRGLEPVAKSGYRARSTGCTVFGYEVKFSYISQSVCINCINRSRFHIDT